VSGQFKHADSNAYPTPFLLRSSDNTITTNIMLGKNNNFSIENLPPGDYIITYASRAMNRSSAVIKEFTLANVAITDLYIDNNEQGSLASPQGYLMVLPLTEQGLPLAGTKVWLEADGEILTPPFETGAIKGFSPQAGKKYILQVEHPGYGSISKEITVKSMDELTTQEILKPLIIIMFKE
jgi:hypothetical protein